MTNSSNTRSVRPIKAVDPFTRRVLRAVAAAAAGVGCRFFVAGATARDLMLVNVFGLPPGRATRDIDFGIAVESWDQFDGLRRNLIATGQFDPAPKEVYRMRCREPGINFRTPVDIIPFGAVAAADKTIAWPPDKNVVMNVAGFQEALESSISLLVEDDLAIRVSSVPGLAMLKVIAWQDRRRENNKDALDLFRLLERYADAGNLDRLYGSELPLLETAGFDLELAAAELLGRDAARICHLETRGQITALLSSDALIDQLLQQISLSGFDDDGRADRISALVSGFRKGFLAP